MYRKNLRTGTTGYPETGQAPHFVVMQACKGHLRDKFSMEGKTCMHAIQFFTGLNLDLITSKLKTDKTRGAAAQPQIITIIIHYCETSPEVKTVHVQGVYRGNT